MKIAILGAGAMGMLFGGLLSQKNQVWLMDVDADRVRKINADGVRIREKDGSCQTFHPAAATDPGGLPPMDLVIVFVKAIHTASALEKNRALIGSDTLLMTLQNGAGHESVLLRFADRQHVVIGTTQHNSSVVENGMVHHGGSGPTAIGLPSGGSSALLPVAERFSACGLPCTVSDDVKGQIWHKLFTNTAASSLTAILQVPLHFIAENPSARQLMAALCREAVAVAAKNGAVFDEEEIISEVEGVCRNARGGYTSIYADIQNGRPTEVDTISGSVVSAAKKAGVPVPCHEMVVALIHALEAKNTHETENRRNA